MGVKVDRTGSRQGAVMFAGVFTAAAAVIKRRQSFDGAERSLWDKTSVSTSPLCDAVTVRDSHSHKM